MGCSDPQEKLENEIIKMNIEKIEIQMEKYKQMKLLGENSKDIKIKDIPYSTNTKININNKPKKNNTNDINIAITKRKTSTDLKPKTRGRRSKSVKTARFKNINI
jgi:hypothetical protein